MSEIIKKSPLKQKNKDLYQQLLTESYEKREETKRDLSREVKKIIKGKKTLLK